MDGQSAQTAKNNPAERVKDEKYAAALMEMANLDYDMQQKLKPPTKHFIPKKLLIYLALSTIISIIFYAGYAIVNHGKPDQGQRVEQKAQEILKDTKELQQY